MFVREHKFGGGLYGARFVTVHTGHLRGPFPALVGEMEAEPADMLRLAAGERRLGRNPTPNVLSIGHLTVNYAGSSSPSAMRLIAIRRRSHC